MYSLLEVLGYRGVENISLDEGWALCRCIFVYVCVLEKNIIEDIDGHLFGTTTTIMLIELVGSGSGRKYTNLG